MGDGMEAGKFIAVVMLAVLILSAMGMGVQGFLPTTRELGGKSIKITMSYPRIIQVENNLYSLMGKRAELIARNIVQEKHVVFEGKLYLIYSLRTCRNIETYFKEYGDGWSKEVYVGGEYADLAVNTQGVFVSSSINHNPWIYYRIGSIWHSQKLSDGWSTVTSVYAGERVIVAWRGENSLQVSLFNGNRFREAKKVDKEKAPIRNIEILSHSVIVKEESLNAWYTLRYITSNYEEWSLDYEKREYKDVKEQKGYSPHTYEKALWTFMVYLNGDNSLSAATDDDLSEMERGFNASGVGKVNIIALWDKAGVGDSKLIRIYPGGYEDISSQASWMSSEVDMGNSTTLVNFVTWIVKNYPAEHYFVDLWNHGGDYFGAMWDDTSGTHLSLEDLKIAADEIRKNIGFKVDIWGYDACLMDAGADNYQVKEVAKILVASEHTEGGDGWDYVALISNLTRDPWQTPEEYAYNFVVHVDDEWSQQCIVTMAAINMTAWDYNFMEAYNFLAQALRHAAGENESIIRAFQEAAKGDPSYWSSSVDVGDFAKMLIKYVNNSEVKNWAERLLENVSGNASKGIPPTVINYMDNDTDGRKIVMAESYSYSFIQMFLNVGIFNETQWDEMISQVFYVGENDTNQEPSVSITEPSNGSVFSPGDVLEIKGTASDPDGNVERVELKIDSGEWKTANGTTDWNYVVELSSLEPGEHRIFVRSFDGDLYSPYAKLKFIINEGVDLKVEKVTLSSSTVNEAIGESMEITAKIVNTGNYMAEDVKVAVYYDAIDEDHLIAMLDAGNIQPMGNASVTASWKPVGIPPGKHYIMVYVDPVNEIQEWNDENNALSSQPVTVLGYSVKVICSDNESYIMALEDTVYRIEIINQGTFNDTFDLKIIGNSSWTAYLSTPKITIAPGESGFVYLRVSSPSTAQPRDKFTVGIEVVSEGNTSKKDKIYTTTYIRSPMILVDDDGGGPWEIFFEEALNANEYIYDVWDVFARGSPTHKDLLPYNVVIWNIGDQWSDTLSAQDEVELEIYLNSGGRLYLSSQDYLYDISWGYDGDIIEPFINDYLGVVGVVNDYGYSSIEGVKDNPISGDFGIINLSYPYYNYADEIEISKSAESLFINPEDGVTVGVNYAENNFRTVFTAFSFEAVENENEGVGNNLMKNIITWLCEGMENRPSAPRNVEVDASSGPVHLTWDEPLHADGVKGYKIYKKSGNIFVKIGETQSRSFLDINIRPNTTYEYYVTAVSVRGESRPGRVVEVTTPLDTVAPEIVGMSPKDVVINDRSPEIEVEWHDTIYSGFSDAIVKIDGIEIAAEVEGDGNEGTVIAKVPFLLADGEHEVEVTLVDNGGNEVTEEWSFEVDATAPSIVIVKPVGNNVALTYEGKLEIKGMTEPGATVMINGNAVDVDSNGMFDVVVNLEKGENVFYITATDAAGNTGFTAVTALYLPDLPAIWENISALKGELSDLEGELNELKGELDSLQGDVGELQGNISEIEGKIGKLKAALEENVSALNKAIEEGKSEVISEVNSNIEELKGEINDLKSNVDEVKKDVKERSDKQEKEIGGAKGIGYAGIVLGIIAIIIGIAALLRKPKVEKREEIEEENVPEDEIREE